MKSVHRLHEFMPYGAPDLIVAQRPQLSRALGLSSTMALSAWLALCAIVPGLAPAPPIELPRVLMPPHHPRHYAPIPEAPASAPPRVVPTPLRKGRFVPAPEAPPLPSADVTDFGASSDPIPTEAGPAGVPGEALEPIAPVDHSLTPVTYVDELPVAAVKVMPEYPGFARDAMVEGPVTVLVLVGPDGRVHDAKLDPNRHSPLLDAAALAAARRWVFSPATVNGHPVAVWTAIPFRFVLSEARP